MTDIESIAKSITEELADDANEYNQDCVWGEMMDHLIDEELFKIGNEIRKNVGEELAKLQLKIVY